MSYLGRSAKLSLKAQEKVSFLATAGQTSKTGLSYTPTFVEVYVNGVLLTDTTDFTATNGNSVTFTVALLLNDEVTVVSLKTFTVADHYNKTEADTLLAAKSPLANPSFTGNVGVGTSSPDKNLHVYNSTTNRPVLIESGDADALLEFKDNATAYAPAVGATGNNLIFQTGAAATERMRIDSSGNVLVGTTSSSLQGQSSNTGFRIDDGGSFLNATTGISFLNKLTSDGDILRFQKDGTAVGSIGVSSDKVYIGTSTNGLAFDQSANIILPWNSSTLSVRDNAIDLGYSGGRFDDIWATNGTIQTSDRNEKQDILAITTAESNVATACKGLLRSFRWKDAVAEKGDDARIHFGIIAQDLQDAFTAEGLDAGRYAMFISSTWWETQTEVPAVEAEDATEDSEAVEAKDAYTRTNTFDTLEEAPEDATERTRLGVRYPELLSFIIAAL